MTRICVSIACREAERLAYKRGYYTGSRRAAGSLATIYNWVMRHGKKDAVIEQLTKELEKALSENKE